jgi:hypothetical protein
MITAHTVEDVHYFNSDLPDFDGPKHLFQLYFDRVDDNIPVENVLEE